MNIQSFLHSETMPWLFQVPADRVTPIVLWFVGLRPALIDGELTGTTVVRLIAASVPIHVVQLHLKTALLAGSHLGQFQRQLAEGGWAAVHWPP